MPENLPHSIAVPDGCGGELYGRLLLPVHIVRLQDNAHTMDSVADTHGLLSATYCRTLSLMQTVGQGAGACVPYSKARLSGSDSLNACTVSVPCVAY